LIVRAGGKRWNKETPIIKKKFGFENWQSSSGIESEQLVESWKDGVESLGVEC
jgi:hypothetical protein